MNARTQTIMKALLVINMVSNMQERADIAVRHLTTGRIC